MSNRGTETDELMKAWVEAMESEPVRRLIQLSFSALSAFVDKEAAGVKTYAGDLIWENINAGLRLKGENIDWLCEKIGRTKGRMNQLRDRGLWGKQILEDIASAIGCSLNDLTAWQG